MSEQLRIGAYKDRYPSSFALPRKSCHDMQARLFVPLSKLRPNLDGCAIYPPFQGEDLLHAYNRVPLNHPRYVISFESHLPRNFGLPERSVARNLMIRDVASNRCRRIIAMSHFAARNFLHQNRALPELETLKRKLMVRYPNVEVPASVDLLADPLSRAAPETLILTFVGGHFARKGGCAILRFAQEAERIGLPVQINIVSSMQMGKTVWTDPTNAEFFDPYLRLLDLPNVTHYPGLPNREALALLARSHFHLMPTFSDTFGFSIIEAMAHHTPTIATNVQAVPEMVVDGHTGLLLNLPTDDTGYWISPPFEMRSEAAYEARYRDGIETLVTQLIERVSEIIGQPERIAEMRRHARRAAEEIFSSEVSGAFYDPFYQRVAEEPISSTPVVDPVLDFASTPVRA